jgi:predicted  nucleic acid-binding Zn-ribbon protein
VSDNDRPEVTAFRELELLVRHLGEELATFRRRALQAEGQLRAVEARGATVADVKRLDALESENTALRRRLDAAASRAQAMLDRVRFLRQQDHPAGGTGGNR